MQLSGTCETIWLMGVKDPTVLTGKQKTPPWLFSEPYRNNRTIFAGLEERPVNGVQNFLIALLLPILGLLCRLLQRFLLYLKLRFYQKLNVLECFNPLLFRKIVVAVDLLCFIYIYPPICASACSISNTWKWKE